MEKSINLSILNFEEQILYFLKTNENQISRELLYNNFPDRKNQINTVIDSLKDIKIINEKDNILFLSARMGNSFCQILDVFFSTNQPIEKYMLRKQIRIDAMQFERLIQSKILSICRSVYGHGDYLYLTTNKEKSIKMMNEKIYLDILKQYKNDKHTSDVILSLWTSNTFTKNENYKLNLDELKIMEYIKKNEIINIQDFFNFIFDKEKIKKILINLIDHGYISGNKQNGKIWITI